jgi:hypothetical protein
MEKTQSDFIDVLRDNKCNISNALEQFPELTLQDFYVFMEDPDFKDAHHAAVQIRDDFANSAFMELIDVGDRMATIEYQKMLRQSDTQNEARRIRHETMKALIQMSESKGQCVKDYCQIFKTTKSQSDEFYKTVLTENNLISPFERKKQRDLDQTNSMAERFKTGNLEELDMYGAMLLIALNDSEYAEYPSERSRAMDKVIDINRRLEEINERMRRDAESDDSNLFDKLDGVLSGTNPSDIAAFREKLMYPQLEVAEDVE